MKGQWSSTLLNKSMKVQKYNRRNGLDISDFRSREALFVQEKSSFTHKVTV